MIVGQADLAALVEAVLSGPRPLPIVQAGHPVLRRRALPVLSGARPLGSRLLADLVEAMRETMHAAPGVGLAAPQVGLPLALAVVEDQWPVEPELAAVRERTSVGFRVLVEPAYEPVVAAGGEADRVTFYEGCLSVAGWQAATPRWRTVRLRADDLGGDPVDEVLTGWPARIVQHETDHLHGRLYLDGAELRSLVSPQEAGRYAGDLTPARAATELGFPL